MSSYKRLLQWIHRTKQRMIESMGGRCQCCHYSIQSTLEFHHINPTEKEFNFGCWKSKSWNKIVIELRKCILVCANCHREIHSHVRYLPESYCKFNEDYATYTPLNKPLLDKRKCKTCQTVFEVPIYSKQKFCKKSCSFKNRKVNWDQIDLVHELKTKNINKIAEELNISWNAVSKRLKKININYKELKKSRNSLES